MASSASGRYLMGRMRLPLRLIHFETIPTRTPPQFPNAPRLYSNTSVPIPPALPQIRAGDEIALARRWVEEFRRAPIPRGGVQMSFARSSGPGGQNVNKVNTKCTIRCPLSATWIPLWAKANLRKSTSYVHSSDALLITSTATRSQAQNIDDCFAKLRNIIIDASTADVKNETSEGQKQRVRNLEKNQKARNRQEKSHRSQTKRSRSKKGLGE